MSVFDAVKGVLRDRGDKRKSEEIVGNLVENPKVVERDGSAERVLVFHLDSRPDVEFHQIDRALASKRRRGDRVKVHCRMTGDGVADVDWMEVAA